MSENGSCDVPFYIYFVLRIRVAEIKKENSGFTCESEHFTGRAAVFY